MNTMTHFLLKSFCFSCSLQTGTKVVGIFSLLSGVGGSVMSVMMFSSETFSDDEENTDESISEISLLQYSIPLIIGSIITILFAILVLIAAWTNRKRTLLLPWLILNPVWMLTGIAYLLYHAVLHWIEQEIAVGLGYAAASASISAIGFFRWLVIFSYYLELRKVNQKSSDFITMSYRIKFSSTCCDRMSLQTATKAIGVFSLLCGSLGYYLAFIDLPDFNPVDAIATFKFPGGVTMPPPPSMWAIVSTITIVVTIFLLFAAWKNRYAGSLLPWLYVHPFLVYTGVGFQLYDGIFSDDHPIERASSITSSLIATAMELYMCVVVYSYRKELEEKAQEKKKNWIETDVEITEPESLLSNVKVALEDESPTSNRPTGRFTDIRDPKNDINNDYSLRSLRGSLRYLRRHLPQKILDF